MYIDFMDILEIGEEEFSLFVMYKGAVWGLGAWLKDTTVYVWGELGVDGLEPESTQ